MKDIEHSKSLPTLGCLIGLAYRRQEIGLEASLNSHGLPVSAPEYLIFRVVMQQPGCQLCEIGDRLCKDKGAISRGVSSLKKKGLVYTVAVSHKCLRVYLTPDGESLIPKISEVAWERQIQLNSILSDDEIDYLKNILNKMTSD